MRQIGFIIALALSVAGCQSKPVQEAKKPSHSALRSVASTGISCVTRSATGELFQETGDDRDGVREKVAHACVAREGAQACWIRTGCRDLALSDDSPVACKTMLRNVEHSGWGHTADEATDSLVWDCLAYDSPDHFRACDSVRVDMSCTAR